MKVGVPISDQSEGADTEIRGHLGGAPCYSRHFRIARRIFRLEQ